MSDPYLYPITKVLKNKLHIHNHKKLAVAEGQYVGFRKAELLDGVQTGRITLPDIHSPECLQYIHNYLFQDVYEWAGDFRQMNMYKNEIALRGRTVDYAEYHSISARLQHVMDQAQNNDWYTILRTNTPLFANYIATLWQIHPFREGNTRTISTYMEMFLNEHDCEIDSVTMMFQGRRFRENMTLYTSGPQFQKVGFERLMKNLVVPIDEVCLKFSCNRRETDMEFAKDNALVFAEDQGSHFHTRNQSYIKQTR